MSHTPGEADELEAKKRRVRLVVFDFDGVFTDNTVLVASDGTESVRCWRSDGLGLRMLRELGLHGLVAAIGFVVILMLGWLYALRKEALKWQ